MEKWQEEIKELRLLDTSNEEADGLLLNAKYLLQNVRGESWAICTILNLLNSIGKLFTLSWVIDCSAFLVLLSPSLVLLFSLKEEEPSLIWSIAIEELLHILLLTGVKLLSISLDSTSFLTDKYIIDIANWVWLIFGAQIYWFS